MMEDNKIRWNNLNDEVLIYISSQLPRNQIVCSRCGENTGKDIG